MSEETINCKIVLVGESTVGKTCILRNFLGEEFQEEHLLTMSAETERKDLIVDNQKVKISISDTAGQEVFRAITKMYYKGADIVIIVYDITNEDTFTAIKNYWINEVINNSTDLKVIGIFGNKADLVDEEKVDEALVREFAKEKKAFFSRTSAKTGSGVEQSIIKLVSEFLKVRKNKESPFGPVREESDKGNIDINNSVKKKGGKCCF